MCPESYAVHFPGVVMRNCSEKRTGVAVPPTRKEKGRADYTEQTEETERRPPRMVRSGKGRIRAETFLWRGRGRRRHRHKETKRRWRCSSSDRCRLRALCRAN